MFNFNNANEIIIRKNKDGYTYNIQAKADMYDEETKQYSEGNFSFPRTLIKLDIDCLKDNNDTLYTLII